MANRREGLFSLGSFSLVEQMPHNSPQAVPQRSSTWAPQQPMLKFILPPSAGHSEWGVVVIEVLYIYLPKRMRSKMVSKLIVVLGWQLFSYLLLLSSFIVILVVLYIF